MIFCALFFFNRKKAATIASHLQDKLQKYLPALISGLVDFQKAQCFFMIAVQVAALVIITRGSLLPAKSIVEVQLNYSLLQMISVNCYLPVTFTLLNLRVFGKKSFYVFLLSLITFSLCVATQLLLTQINMSGIISPIGPPECGAISLTSWCTISLSDNYDEEDGQSINSTQYSPLAATIMALLAIDQFLVLRLIPLRRLMRLAPRLRHKDRIKYWIKTVAYLVVCIFYALAFATQIMNLQSLIKLGAIDTKSWGFGQIVAITVWLAPLVDYFKSVFRECNQPR